MFSVEEEGELGTERGGGGGVSTLVGWVGVVFIVLRSTGLSSQLGSSDVS